MKKPSFKVPSFRKPLPAFKAVKDPLKGLPDADNSEAAAAQEVAKVGEALSERDQGFRDRASAESNRFQDATDTGYYTCIVMENRDQLDALIAHFRGMGATLPDDLFIDGREIARILGCDMPRLGEGGGKPAKVDKAFAKMVRKD